MHIESIGPQSIVITSEKKYWNVVEENLSCETPVKGHSLRWKWSYKEGFFCAALILPDVAVFQSIYK